VYSVHTALHDSVCRDSCVEFFVAPRDGHGYLNFEFNCGGTMHCSHVRDSTRTAAGFADFSLLAPEQAARVGIHHSMPAVVDPPLAVPVTWFLGFSIPFSLLEDLVGPLGPPAGQSWRANFYKCGGAEYHEHWVSWSPVAELNFHLPMCFGCLMFEP